MSFNLNGQTHDIPPDWADGPLLFLLREHFGLTGTKFGCGVCICGARTRCCQTNANQSAFAQPNSCIRPQEGRATRRERRRVTVCSDRFTGGGAPSKTGC
jgi:aerobic-type carbon monoxide dehydrogenase small subunit (CoxS/CutS family)